MNKVLVDIDGIIANFFVGFANYLNEKLNAKIDLGVEPSSYSFSGWSNLPSELVDAEIENWVRDGGYLRMPIYPGAKEFMESLVDKYEVFVVTARLGGFRNILSPVSKKKIWQDTIDWFNNYELPADKVIFDHKKVEFCLENKIPVLIEDKLTTVLEAVEGGIKPILLDRGWNRDMSRIDENIYIAYDYEDILQKLQSLFGEKQ